MSAESRILANGNYGWRAIVEIEFFQLFGTTQFKSHIVYEWDSGSAAVFDCTVARTLTYDSVNSCDPYFCSGWDTATVTLTPV